MLALAQCRHPAGAADVRRRHGLRAAGVWYAAANAAGCLLILLAVFRLARRLPAARGQGDLSLRSFALYSLSLALGPVAWIVTFQCDKLFIANALPLSELTLYAVPAGLLQRLQVLPAVISTTLIPMMSELSGPQTQAALTRMYLKATRVVLWAVLPALVLFFALMPQLLTLWLGPEFGLRSVWPARLLVMSQAFFLLTFIPNSVAAGRGKPWYLSAAAWGQAAVSVLAWWWLIPRYSILGAALGSLLAQALPAVFYLRAVHKNILRLSWPDFLEGGLYAPLTSAAVLLAVVFPAHAWASSWPRLLALSGAGCALYYGSTWLLLDGDEREVVLKLMRWQRPGEAA